MELLIDLILKYGWQSVVVAVLTFFLIELIKPLARKLISKSEFRHTLYYILSYPVALGWAAGLAFVLGVFESYLTLYGTAMVVINILSPFISNIGFWDWIEGIVKDVISKLTDFSSWKKALNLVSTTFGVDCSTLSAIVVKLALEYPDLSSVDAGKFISENAEELVLNLKQKLAGFVDNEALQDAADALFDALKIRFKVDSTEV